MTALVANYLICLAWPATIVRGVARKHGNPDAKTARGVDPPPAVPDLPPAGRTFVDPAFGTTIMRVTDESNGNSNHHATRIGLRSTSPTRSSTS
jgi:hypothetical protein